jgi:acetyl-CoA carboxylase biotin carboxyl carrier protein
MDAQQIKAFIDAMAASDLAEMEFSRDGWTLRLVRHPADVASSAAALPFSRPVAASAPIQSREPSAVAPRELSAPLYGVVHLRPSPGEPPFVAVGQTVRAGQTLCVIEAMKVFNEVRAEFDATVDAVLVASAQEVEAGQSLFRFA